MARHYDPNIHHRQSTRLRGYDYAQAGAYFVTICVQGRQCLFGDVVDGEMQSNDIGEIMAGCWHDIPTHFPHVTLDAFVVMPNHVHGIIIIDHDRTGTACNEGEHKVRPYTLTRRGEPCVRPVDSTRPNGTQPSTLGRCVQAFKSRTTHAYIQGVRQHGWPPFDGRLWQRNYYDHIIRNDNALDRIRDYIATNPLRWDEDQLHPGNLSKW